MRLHERLFDSNIVIVQIGIKNNSKYDFLKPTDDKLVNVSPLNA